MNEDILLRFLRDENGDFCKRISVDDSKRCENASVGENILLRFLRDENGDFWKRISVGENILLRFLRDENGDFWKRISVDGALRLVFTRDISISISNIRKRSSVLIISTLC